MRRLILLALFFTLTAQALPESLRLSDPAWRRWGSGEMRWLGFSLYHATLWVAGESPESSPTALQLEYRRDIARERLVQTSLDEMRRMGSDESQLKRWEADLQRVFPEVRAGDSIVGVHYPGHGARFYHQGRSTGVVADAEFARRFFAIWLAPATRSPALRAALLSRPEG